MKGFQSVKNLYSGRLEYISVHLCIVMQFIS